MRTSIISHFSSSVTVTVSPGAVSRVNSFVSSRLIEEAVEVAAKAARRVGKRIVADELGTWMARGRREGVIVAVGCLYMPPLSSSGHLHGHHPA